MIYMEHTRKPVNGISVLKDLCHNKDLALFKHKKDVWHMLRVPGRNNKWRWLQQSRQGKDRGDKSERDTLADGKVERQTEDFMSFLLRCTTLTHKYMHTAKFADHLFLETVFILFHFFTLRLFKRQIFGSYWHRIMSLTWIGKRTFKT